ncbi:MAG: peptide chain release factor N(5)-glutamine methyltransferase [Nitriliruptor sp.]
MPPLRDRLEAAERCLRAAGVPDPAGDAHTLARHVLDLDDTDDLTGTLDVTGHDAATFDELVARRADRVPLPHLTGSVRFRGIELAVGPGVFVPQPETAPVVGWAVDAVRSSGRAAPLVADLCTGSGTIAFALANELPHAHVHAVERDPGAMAWARRNAAARRAAGDPPVTLHLGDVEGCLPDLDGRLDLVASNPPYVATTERHVPDREVVDHDPAIALWAGDDGLDIVRLVERAARRLLRTGGQIVVEHSDRQGVTAPAVFTSAGGWAEIADHPDQDGLDRFVTARWTGS